MSDGDVIGQKVRTEREKKGLSVNALAKKIGVRLNTIQAIESGATQKSKYLPDIARVLEIPLSQIDPSQEAGVSQQRHVPLAQVVGARDVPVYGATEGGGGTMVISSEPVDLTDRPSSIAHVKNAYAVIVTGESMLPIVRPGDIVIINPLLHPRRDDLCIFRTENHGEFRSLVKEFVARVEGGWKVRRYKPTEREYVLKAAEWPQCHVVVAIHRR